MSTTTYRVRGMTCEHCVQSVSREIAMLPGVREVAVDLKSGAVSVTSEAELDPAAVRLAVDEAGYELVD